MRLSKTGNNTENNKVEQESVDVIQRTSIPEIGELEDELKREKFKNKYLGVLRSTIFSLITVAAASILIAVLLLPVLQIYGHSMNPTLDEGNIVVSIKYKDFETGDLVAFYWNNRVLVKRVIGLPGDYIDLDHEGNVIVNGTEIEEPYLINKDIGECDISLPYQVPEGRIFVMGDNRKTSIDSRSKSIGCIGEEQIVGKIEFRIWPLKLFGRVG